MLILFHFKKVFLIVKKNDILRFHRKQIDKLCFSIDIFIFAIQGCIRCSSE